MRQCRVFSGTGVRCQPGVDDKTKHFARACAGHCATSLLLVVFCGRKSLIIIGKFIPQVPSNCIECRKAAQNPSVISQ